MNFSWGNNNNNKPTSGKFLGFNTGIPELSAVNSNNMQAWGEAPPLQYQPNNAPPSFNMENTDLNPYTGGDFSNFGKNNSWLQQPEKQNNIDYFNLKDEVSPVAGEGGGGSNKGMGFLDYTDEHGNKISGWGMPALNLGMGAMNTYLGFEQLDLAKENFDFQKDSFEKQYENQRTLTNASLEDRQKARAARSKNAVPVDEYMKKHGV